MPLSNIVRVSRHIHMLLNQGVTTTKLLASD
ncbi:hypothetical protein T09_1450 [Trichinella sp. T9]|nr:hypothetical protein T09_7226 [Trichinella sp. T9]KRX29033.1 hypothetical protein T09_1450 [Trichinella sp. T9]